MDCNFMIMKMHYLNRKIKIISGGMFSDGWRHPCNYEAKDKVASLSEIFIRFRMCFKMNTTYAEPCNYLRFLLFYRRTWLFIYIELNPECLQLGILIMSVESFP